jgi:hypothetical protein
MKVTTVEFKYDSDGLEFITCHLNNNKKFDIEPYDYYFWLIENVDNFKKYSDKFESWTDLTDDLKSLQFDFNQYCEKYINSEFSTTEISEFVYN